MREQNDTKRISWRLAQLAEASGLSLAFLRKAAYASDLKTRKVGAAVIVFDEDARAFLAGEPQNDDAQQQDDCLTATA